MKLGVCSASLASIVLLAASLCARPAAAQQANAAVAPKPPAQTLYDLRRESVLQGTVVNFTANSAAPFAANAVIQTASGSVDVQLGDARLLASRQLSLNPGDSVKIVGENLVSAKGTQFVARIVQKGEQVVAVRSPRGFPLKPSAKLAGGAL